MGVNLVIHSTTQNNKQLTQANNERVNGIVKLT